MMVLGRGLVFQQLVDSLGSQTKEKGKPGH